MTVLMIKSIMFTGHVGLISSLSHVYHVFKSCVSFIFYIQVFVIACLGIYLWFYSIYVSFGIMLNYVIDIEHDENGFSNLTAVHQHEKDFG